MEKTQLGICALTGERCELQESHIYPKFVYKYLKKLREIVSVWQIILIKHIKMG